MALDCTGVRGTGRHLVENQRPMPQVHVSEMRTGVILTEQIVGEKDHGLRRMEAFLTLQWPGVW
jgi:hypothetical protein